MADARLPSRRRTLIKTKKGWEGMQPNKCELVSLMQPVVRALARASSAGLFILCIFWMLHAAAKADPIVTSTTGTNWLTGFGAPTYSINARFRATAGAGPWTNAASALDFKGQGASPSTINTSTINFGPLNFPTAAGFGTSTRSYTLTGIVDQDYATTFSYDVKLSQPNPPPSYIEGQAWVADPIGYQVGSSGTTLDYTVSLLKGSAFLATEVDPGHPNLEIDTRFGLGSSFSPSDPSTLFGAGIDQSPYLTTPPTGAYDLYDIGIVQNASGTGVQANVSPDLPSTLAGFGLTSNETSAQIKSLIQSADWILSGDFWILQSNLELYDITFTNNSVTSGSEFVIGSLATAASTSTAVMPEPSSLALMGSAAACWMLVSLRLRRRMMVKRA